MTFFPYLSNSINYIAEVHYMATETKFMKIFFGVIGNHM